MVGQVATVAFEGADARPVDVQVQITGGASAFTIVGLADKAVAESRERVRAAFASLGLALPAKRVVVNLAPADLPKEGAHFDVPIALGVMAAMDVLPKAHLAEYAAFGELALDAHLRACAGALPAAMAAHGRGLGVVCPTDCAPEAAWAGQDAEILGATHLMDIVNHFKGAQVITPAKPGALRDPPPTACLSDVRGQALAKRALEIAAAGGHNLVIVGPPGSGKSMLAERLAGLLPPLSPREVLEVSVIHSVAGLLRQGELSRARPFRSPHHSASLAALTGGGPMAKPGEASLAHHGVLFLDELPEFHPRALDGLRQPLETGEISVARAARHVRYDAKFQLVAAMNPCRCGVAVGACARGPRCATAYQARVSGPLMDRLDLRIEAPAVTAIELAGPATGPTSKEAAQRVSTARTAQTDRFGEAAPCVARMTPKQAEAVCAPDDGGRALLAQAAERFALTARGHQRSLRVARTIADLEGADGVRRSHVAEALAMRRAPSLVGAQVC